MIRLNIRHKLQRKVDQLEMVPIKVQAAVKEAMIASIEDTKEDLKNFVGDKSHWFDVRYEEGSNDLRISPTSSTSGDPEKMRLYNWFMTNHGDQIAKNASDCVKRNIKLKYKEHGLGDRYGY